MDLTGAQRVTFDMTYDPADKTTGTFSVKAFSKAGIDQYVEIDESAAQTTSDGLLKNEVTIDFTALTEEQGSAVNDLTLALIGVNTDYQGDILIDNVTIIKMPKVQMKRVRLANPRRARPENLRQAKPENLRQKAMKMLQM